MAEKTTSNSRNNFNYSLVYPALFAIIAAGFLFFFLDNYQQPSLSSVDELKKFSSLAELKDYIKSNQDVGGYYDAQRSTLAVENLAAPTQAGAASEKSADYYSTTNIQVAGVDEADTVKNDGKYIYTVAGSNVVITDAYPAENAAIISTINMSGSAIQGLYVNGNRLVVFTNTYNNYYIQPLVAEDTPVESKMLIRPSFPNTMIKVYDISDRYNPALKRELSMNGSYYNSRMIGDYVYAVVNAPIQYYGDDIVVPLSGFPDVYYFDFPDYSYQLTTVLSVNVNDDNKEPQSKVFLLGYSNVMFVSKDNIFLTYQKRVKPAEISDRIVKEVIIPTLPDDVATEVRKIVDSDVPYYEKENQIQEAVGSWLEQQGPEKSADIFKAWEEKVPQIYAEIAKETDKSVIHKISIGNGEIIYKTRGEVPGQPLNQFSMDEYNGYFRIATTTSGSGGFGFPVGVAVRSTGGEAVAAVSQAEPAAAPPAEQTKETEAEDRPLPTPQPEAPRQSIVQPRPRASTLNHLYVLDESMNIVGKVEDLAPGERIYSARFIGDRAYLVTFVRIDPLFVIDLSDPRNPRVLGELKIPGVSDYLHPYDENHIIGVGQATEEMYGRVTFSGLKISLFDVSDVANPRELAKYEIGDRGTSSEALYDHKAFLFSKDRNLLVLPVLLAEKDYQYTWQGAYVFDLTLQNGFTLKGKISHDEPQGQAEKPEYYYPRYPVRRSLYIGDTLYTVSDAAIKANSLNDLAEIRTIQLPVEQQVYYYSSIG